MHEAHPRRAPGGAPVRPAAAGVAGSALVAGWRDGLAIVNLRGNASDPAWRDAASRGLGMELPLQPCTTTANGVGRVVWAGPDDWFVIGPEGGAEATQARLRAELAGLHHAVTDVSSGYAVLHLSGAPARDVLSQGCPLDLHPRVFMPGASAGSAFFRTSVWLWRTDDAEATFEVLVRSSFKGYFRLMLERCTQECGLTARCFA